MVSRDVTRRVARIEAPLPHHGAEEVVPSKHLIHHDSAVSHLGIIEMNPDRPIWRQEVAYLRKPISHHRQPDRVLEGIVVVKEALLSIERWVEVGELYLAEVLVSELRQAGQAPQRVKSITSDQEIVPGSASPDRSDRRDVVKEPDFRDAVVRGCNPFVRAVLVRKQAELLVGPGQLEAPLVRSHRSPSRPISKSECAPEPGPPCSGYRGGRHLAWLVPSALPHDADIVSYLPAAVGV